MIRFEKAKFSRIGVRKQGRPGLQTGIGPRLPKFTAKPFMSDGIFTPSVTFSASVASLKRSGRGLQKPIASVIIMVGFGYCLYPKGIYRDLKIADIIRVDLNKDGARPIHFFDHDIELIEFDFLTFYWNILEL